MKDPFSLSEKTILITGASSGIGRACALEFARLGANILASGKSAEKLDSLKDEISDASKHKFMCADLADPQGVKDLCAQFENIDGLVFCTGIENRSLIKFANIEDLKATFDVNYFSAFFLAKELLKMRKINKSGSLLFISSVSAFMSSAAHFAYANSKAALISFAKDFALESASRAVRSNALSLGLIETPMTCEFLNSNPQERAIDEKKYPLGYGNVSDAVNAARYFMADASRWVTGSNFVIDGGYSFQK